MNLQMPFFSRPSAPARSSTAVALCGLLLMAWLLAACTHPVLRKADKLRGTGQHEQALQALKQAHQAQPTHKPIKAAFVKQRDTTVAHLLAQMQSASVAVDSPAYEDWLKRLEAAAPDDPRVQALRQNVQRRQRIQALVDDARQAMDASQWARAEAALRAVLSTDDTHVQARQLLAQIDDKRTEETRQQSNVQLATSTKPITLEFRDASLRTVFEALARAANINFVFDKDIRGEAKVTLYLRNTTVEEALRVITNTQQLGTRLLNANTVLVFPNTTQKQRELLDTVTRSFYLVNADPKQVQNLVRTVAKTRDMFVDERLNLLVVRDTPDVIRLVERLVASVDLPDPEVMLELEVMEVSSKRLEEIGLTLPATASYGVIAADGLKLSSELLTSRASGMRWSYANPAAIASLRGSVDATNLLANPKIRARNREKAKISLGEKLPVFTTTTTTGTATSTSVNISYVDVGLKLDLEPQIQLNDEVIIKVGLDVTNITGRVAGPQDFFAYQVGSRQASTSLRLKDGETQVLAGLINDDDSQTSAGLPWLHELPGLGRLFGKTTDTRNKTEVVLLITPRIIRNLSQENLPLGSMTSGTENQPGAAPFVVSQGQVQSDLGQGSGGSISRTVGATRTQEAIPPGPRLTGPQTAMQGSTIQVTVHNPQPQALSTTITYDTSVFEDVPGKTSGRLGIMVPPNGRMSQTLRIKKDASAQQTEVRMDASPSAWPIQIVNAVNNMDDDPTLNDPIPPR